MDLYRICTLTLLYPCLIAFFIYYYLLFTLQDCTPESTEI